MKPYETILNHYSFKDICDDFVKTSFPLLLEVITTDLADALIEDTAA